MNQGRSKPGVIKKLCFQGVVLFVFVLCCELAARAVLYQAQGGHPLAVVEAFQRLQGKISERNRDSEVEQALPYVPVFRDLQKRLHQEEGQALRDELESTYAIRFQELVTEVRAVGSEFLVVDFLMGRKNEHGRFVAGLCESNGVDFVDLNDVLRPVPIEHQKLTPADRHLSRYGNHLIAVPLAARLDDYAGHASGQSYSGSPAILGDAFLRYGDDDRQRLTSLKPGLGFSMIRNAQGFRMSEDLDIPKGRQRVLFLGDSYTFGPHLNNQDTLPAILARLRPQLEVLNGGISGYTITDQLELFTERAKFAAPDVTLLQVCQNDLVELTAFVRNLAARSGAGSYQPSEAEQQLLARVREDLATNSKK